MAKPKPISREIDIAAPAAKIFDILANPKNHKLIDGSGTVKGTVGRGKRLHEGSRFRMRMRLGLPYLISNKVVEFDENRRIGWRHFNHHVWRYELEPTDDGHTRVRETFDPTTARSPRLLRRLGFLERNTEAIEATLPRLKDAAESR